MANFLSDNSLLSELYSIDREGYALGGALALMHWDQEVYMPPKGIELRAASIASLSGVVHDYSTNPRIRELIHKLEAEIKRAPDKFTNIDRAYIRQARRDFELSTKLPRKFVQQFSETVSRATQSWQSAKEEDNFDIFRPDLEKILDLSLEKAEYIGYKNSPYDALLDLHEVGATEKWIDDVFREVKDKTVSLLRRIEQKGVIMNDRILFGDFDLENQSIFARELVEWLGYDLSAGRIDLSSHPFTIDFGGPQDVRITTRVRRDQVNYALMSTIHETGHAVYEQRVNPEFTGSSLSSGVSLGIHESQSRFFENQVGRSLPFWRHWYSRLQGHYPDQLPPDGLREFYTAINLVRPSLIRTEADELTYNLHIILRFEIEKGLVSKKYQVRDLPEIWREKMREYIGIVPETNREGVLQDVHWSHGSFGYFPTYTLGNLYSAQFAHKMSEALDWQGEIEKGDFSAVRSWLSENIHQYGKVYWPDELTIKVTGETLNPKHFVDYLEDKYSEIYQL
jgi:carboxypeptidase Taq